MEIDIDLNIDVDDHVEIDVTTSSQILTQRIRLLQSITMDKDTTNTLLWRMDERTCEVPIYYDPGHVKKNMVKQLQKICKQAQGYKDLPGRIGHWFMRTVKESEAKAGGNKALMRAFFLDNWAATYSYMMMMMIYTYTYKFIVFCFFEDFLY